MSVGERGGERMLSRRNEESASLDNDLECRDVTVDEWIRVV